MFFRKQKLPEKEVKNVPDLGRAMAVAGYAPANWLMNTPDKFAKEGYMQNATVYACVQKIANAVASVDLSVYRYDGDDKVKIDNSPLYELLDRPNPYQGGAALIRAIVSYKKITGNAYLLKMPYGSMAPTELWALRPDRVKVLLNDKGYPAGYEYSTGMGKIVFPVNDDGTCDVLHLKEFHPLDDTYGLSPMQSAAYSVDIVNQANNWNMSLLQNGARPSGAFIMKTGDNNTDSLSEEQFARLREQLQKDTGAAAAGRPLIIEGGLDWKEMSLSPRDMDFQQNMWAACRMIATAYGVPPQLVNIPGESTYANFAEAKISLWQETVLPELDYILDEINNWLGKIVGDNVFIMYDAESIPALQSIAGQKRASLEAVSFMTINEKRREAGLDDVEGGDVILVDSNKVPIGILSDANEE